MGRDTDTADSPAINTAAGGKLANRHPTRKKSIENPHCLWKSSAGRAILSQKVSRMRMRRHDMGLFTINIEGDIEK